MGAANHNGIYMAGTGDEVEGYGLAQRGLIHSMKQVVLTCLKGLESKHSLPILKTWLVLP